MVNKQITFETFMLSTDRQLSFQREVAYTNDVNSVQLSFDIKDLDDLSTYTPNVLLYMRDGSFYQITDGITKTGTTVSYTLKGNEGKHNGVVRVQLVLIDGDKDLASAKHEFRIETGLDNVVATEVMIQDWTTLVKEAHEYIDEFYANESERQSEFDNNEADRYEKFYNAQADRDNLMAEAAATIGDVVLDPSTVPGGKIMVAGDRENGFYGFVQPRQLGEIEGNPEGQKKLNASNLALAIGLSSGTAINQNTAWMKFSRKGEIYLVPVKPLRHSASWNAIYNQGAVYGDGTNGVNPPNGRAGKRLSVDGTANAFVIEPLSDDGFLRSSAELGVVGDTIVTRGFANEENNGEFVIQSITDTAITVSETLVDEPSAPKASIYEKTKAVKQDRDVVVGGNRYRIQLLKGSEQDPLNSFADSDRDMVGPNSEWNHLILPMHERAKLQDWRYKSYAGTTEDWGIGLTDADLITHRDFGTGNYTWCQETSDEEPYRRVTRGYGGASYGARSGSWNTYSAIGWRPVLRLLP